MWVINSVLWDICWENTENTLCPCMTEVLLSWTTWKDCVKCHRYTEVDCLVTFPGERGWCVRWTQLSYIVSLHGVCLLCTSKVITCYDGCLLQLLSENWMSLKLLDVSAPCTVLWFSCDWESSVLRQSKMLYFKTYWAPLLSARDTEQQSNHWVTLYQSPFLASV